MTNWNVKSWRIQIAATQQFQPSNWRKVIYLTFVYTHFTDWQWLNTNKQNWIFVFKFYSEIFYNEFFYFFFNSKQRSIIFGIWIILVYLFCLFQTHFCGINVLVFDSKQTLLHWTINFVFYSPFSWFCVVISFWSFN